MYFFPFLFFIFEATRSTIHEQKADNYLPSVADGLGVPSPSIASAPPTTKCIVHALALRVAALFGFVIRI
jgi:hypothetical protein